MPRAKIEPRRCGNCRGAHNDLADGRSAKLGPDSPHFGKVVFEHLKQMLTHEPDRPSQAKIAQELGMTENAAKEAEIIATTIPPTDDLESAIVATLPADGYTAIVRGKDNTVGLALVEVYQVNN